MLNATLSLVLLAGQTFAAVPQYAMLPIRCGEGATDKICQDLGTAIAAEFRRYPALSLITEGEIESVLTHEQHKMMLGCSNPNCYVDVGKALGVPRLVTGSYGVLGSSQLISLTVLTLQPVKVVGAVSKRLKGANIDDTLDAIPVLVGEALQQTGLHAREAAVGTSPAGKGSRSLPPAFAELAYDQPISGELMVLSDGHGTYLAVYPDRKEKVLFAGDGERMYGQRLGSSGYNKDDFSFSFWDPRFATGGERVFYKRGDVYTLRCGKKKILLQTVDEKIARRLRAGWKLLRARWARKVFGLARDDKGVYYFVDEVRNPDDRLDDETDYHLFIGRKKRVEHFPLEDAIVESDAAIFMTDKGRLVFEEGKKKAYWAVGETKTPLKVLDLYSQSRLIYRKLGAYQGQALGTACDPFI